ncbi:hypothetical protein AB1Y20_004163 [Prymnesium parvum]|uniref:cellulose 1,4-beta-cellobiosidase (non-reducing end) n=1 Tax=Prymnesium parvum TaxID=97485 RepID=A0AB34J9F5_PRYPA
MYRANACTLLALCLLVASKCPEWCDDWVCDGSWCTGGRKPDDCLGCGACPDWCASWECDGSLWCAGGEWPEPCQGCACPEWCHGWRCDRELWCRDGAVPEVCEPCSKKQAAAATPLTGGELKTYGPVPSAGATVGWVTDHAKNAAPSVSKGPGPLGVLTVTGDTRMYLVNDYDNREWQDLTYVRFDLRKNPLVVSVDLSHVPCGCVACVYLVAMRDPDPSGSQYCDMAENVGVGYGGGVCYEIDIFEANNNAMQSALHTKLGGEFGSGECDRNGCFARIGGPQSPEELQSVYGKGMIIDTTRMFKVRTSLDEDGALSISLEQDGNVVQSFSRSMAGNPQGSGVPDSALWAALEANGKLALVASLWSGEDQSWLDGPDCKQCDLASASYTLQAHM